MSIYRTSFNEMKQKNRKRMRLVFLVLVVVFGVVIVVLFNNYAKLTKTVIKIDNGGQVSLYIPTGSDYQYVRNQLDSLNILIDADAFEWLVEKTEYNKNVHPGRYVFTDGMTNKEAVNMLRLGHQTPVKVVFNNMRTVEQLAGRISSQIEADSLSILDAIMYDSTVDATTFIPNTYEFYWNTDAEGFVNKMKTEYNNFWNETRLKKAEAIGLTPREVSILASIIDKETAKTSEMPTIAGVYINRLDKKWPLQADPTLIYAIGDFSIRRVLDVHKQVESPYNTYKYTGLPPGPICIPSIAAIDAVLNAEKHKYFYFCAKDDLSGYHVFAKTINEHNRNAEKYRRALNKNNIYR